MIILMIFFMQLLGIHLNVRKCFAHVLHSLLLLSLFGAISFATEIFYSNFVTLM